MTVYMHMLAAANAFRRGAQLSGSSESFEGVGDENDIRVATGVFSAHHMLQVDEVYWKSISAFAQGEMIEENTCSGDGIFIHNARRSRFQG